MFVVQSTLLSEYRYSFEERCFGVDLMFFGAKYTLCAGSNILLYVASTTVSYSIVFEKGDQCWRD